MQFYVGSSPHISTNDSIQKLMIRVIIALSPAYIYSAFVFGPRVFLLLIVAISSCLLFEVLVNIVRKKPIHIEDCTAVITAMLLVMTLPPSMPVPHVIIGSAVAIIFGKEIFGGLGNNIFNPALVGRAFLHLSFSARMINYQAPSNFPFGIGQWQSNSVTDGLNQTKASLSTIDAFTQSTPLGFMKDFSTIVPETFLERISYESIFYPSMLFGNTSGTIGETSFALLFLGAIFLLVTKSMQWRIPAGILISSILFSLILSLAAPEKFVSPIYTVLAGGFAIGAFFMATDMVTSPLTRLGSWIYAIFIGLMIIILRNFSNNPEGVMYAILLGNCITPLINMFTRPQVFGKMKVLQKKQS